MAVRNFDCQYQRSHRSSPVERPKSLRRGQGVGGGNYSGLASDGSFSSPSSAGMPSSSSSVCSKPAVPSSAASSSRPSVVESKYRRSSRDVPERPYRASTEGQYRENRPSTSAVCQKKTASSRKFSTGNLPSNKTPEGLGPRENRNLSSSPTTRNVSTSGQKCEIRRKSGTPMKNSRVCSKAPSSKSSSASSSSATRERFTQGPGDSRVQATFTASPSKPGPSCLRAPLPGNKKRVQFVGMSSVNLGSTPDTRSKYKQVYRDSSPSVNGAAKVDPTNCSSPAPFFGPSLYPIYPDQYETPLVSMPGPRQVLLMPGDIDPNETTIIDVVGLNEGDIEEVPGIPPQAPASLLNDAWNQSVREAVEQDLQRRKAADQLKGGKKTFNGSSRNKKKEEQQGFLPNFSHQNFIHQGRSFPFENHGNVRVDDPNNPPYEGPDFLTPDPQCQRARPFTYKSRKTSIRPYTDEERREMEEAETYRTIRAIICEHDAKWERDRVSRGLADDDLIDMDAEECVPSRNVQPAPRDIFAHTDQCNFGEQFLPRSPEICAPPTVKPQREVDLIAWDETAFLPTSCEVGDTDLVSQTPSRPRKRMPSVTSPNLMNVCEPDVDILGLRTPPNARTPSPPPRRNQDDLIRWETPQGSLPFDNYDETLFDAMTRTSPTASRLKTPPLRIVRAVPRGDDPYIAVLEGSSLAFKPSQAAVPFITSIEEEDEDESLGILNYDDPCSGNVEPWQQWNNFEEDFYRPSTSGERRRPQLDMSGVAPLDQYGEDESLGILEEDCIPNFELNLEAETRFRAESKYQSMFQPLVQGNQRIEDEECPFEPGFDELQRRFVEERADLLNMYHEPDASPVQKKPFGRLGEELLEQCQDPIEQCADLIGLTRQTTSTTPPKSMGPFGRELMENCPEEQQLINIDDECTPEQPPPSTKFNYSKDLFTNVEWNPCMAPKAPDNRNK